MVQRDGTPGYDITDPADPADVGVQGRVDAGYEPLAVAFARLLAEDELGAALCVVRGGRTVVDLWGGTADTTTGAAWTADTRVLTFSCTKSLASACAAALVDAGELDLDAPVARYWPEFAAAGKAEHTVREVLCHRAGLVYPETDLTLGDLQAWTPVVEVLQAQRPQWPRGAGFAYHPLTFGWLVGEIIRRITGTAPRTAFRELLADPVGVGVRIGVEPDDADPPIARLEPRRFEFDDPELAAAEEAAFSDPRVARAFTLGGALQFPIRGLGTTTNFNDPAVRALDMPAVNATGSARDLALLHAALVGAHGGSPLLSRAVRDDVLRPRSSGAAVFGPENRSAWGTGFMLDSAGRPMLGPRSFGHDGAGGALVFADDAYDLGFAYVPNRMGALPDERSRRLVAALRACVAR
ncbi:CubicO group peptidase, beta-lactamase class C family [Pseudonocardia thermophila]|jgi:Beta-lactamase class C and other penicillin binding proteins|uniref:CubicO group peptidase, beta-lactamase class C family n=1 Tax=Pseudonocardia thermophila TaxID=1848 RepID=A0A1M6TRT6_PSETH|nr:serine hydrolase domain-containing protein [Pseudonocardia thermophila]SHK59646.1 CubicO group peptidase, beta-lactamase class C family [Pseudonocardia thermophila]